MIEQTLSIIKPDATRRGFCGEIMRRFESQGLKIVAMKMVMFSRQLAEQFYAEHANRPFYASLINYMTSGPVVVMVLQGENAIKKNREIMGDTDPAKAAKGTIRADFAESKEANSVHGSDSAESARREMDLLFASSDIYSEY